MKWQELNKQQEKILVEKHLESIVLLKQRKKIKKLEMLEYISLIDLDVGQ